MFKSKPSGSGFAVLEIIIFVIVVGIIAAVVWNLLNDEEHNPSPPQPSAEELANRGPEPNEHDIHPDVWTKNGYDGPSYEFKVNCGANYGTLNDCFLWDITRVVVTDPVGETYELDKDFNVNSFSGEITRRWVLYGPANAGFPEAGSYRFDYYRGSEIVYSDDFEFAPELVSYPTNITWERSGNDLIVNWQPPDGMREGMTYKVIIFRSAGQVVSQLAEWDDDSAVLKGVPFVPGEEIDLNVSTFFEHGYAYPEGIRIVW